MWGAIIGDLAGSIFEYEQHSKVSYVTVDKLIVDDSFYSDDTILTIAIYEAIRNGQDYEKVLREYGKRYLDYVPETRKTHFPTTFGGNFIRWIKGEVEGNSIGNGAMMRISGIGKMFDTEEEVVEQAMLATKPSHNSLEAIECARTVALFILYARQGYRRLEILEKLGIKSIEYKPFETFNKTCYETLNNCLYAIYDSINFEDAIKKVLNYGGDTDTNAAIVGAMAESLYGVPEYLVEKAKSKIPGIFTYVIEDSYIRKSRHFRRLK